MRNKAIIMDIDFSHEHLTFQREVRARFETHTPPDLKCKTVTGEMLPFDTQGLLGAESPYGFDDSMSAGGLADQTVCSSRQRERWCI
jgi:hypothetical protein